MDYYRHFQVAFLYVKIPYLAYNHVYGKFRDIFNIKAVSMGISLSQFSWLADLTHCGRRRNKQPDECFYTKPIVIGQWPVLVIEAGMAETMAELRRDRVANFLLA